MRRDRTGDLASQAERASGRIKRIAALLDCDESQVRRLISAGELEAHGIGRRGVRVYLDSLEAYRLRHSILPRGTIRKAQKPLFTKSAKNANDIALEELRKDGII
jgi:excisionase family DNA binding protein